MTTQTTREVLICAIRYTMSIVDGGVLFSEKSGFYGVTNRVIFEYCSGLWYLTTAESTWDRIALPHLVKMASLLKEHIGDSHEVVELKFKDA